MAFLCVAISPSKGIRVCNCRPSHIYNLIVAHKLSPASRVTLEKLHDTHKQKYFLSISIPVMNNAKYYLKNMLSFLSLSLLSLLCLFSKLEFNPHKLRFLAQQRLTSEFLQAFSRSFSGVRCRGLHGLHEPSWKAAVRVAAPCSTHPALQRFFV